MNDQTVQWLADLLQDRRKSLSVASPEILKLAELALEKTFRPYSRRQEEIFGGAGRFLRVPRPLGDKDKSEGGSDDGNDDESGNESGNESHDQDGDGEDDISHTPDSPSTGKNYRSEDRLRYCTESCTDSGASITADGAEVYRSDTPAAAWPVHRQRLYSNMLDGHRLCRLRRSRRQSSSCPFFVFCAQAQVQAVICLFLLLLLSQPW